MTADTWTRKPRTQEHCDNISKALKGRPAHNKGKKWTPEQKEQARLARLADPTIRVGGHPVGTKLSEETKAKMKAYQSSRPKVTCPHCNKTGGAVVMFRHHMDKCKFKPATEVGVES